MTAHRSTPQQLHETRAIYFTARPPGIGTSFRQARLDGRVKRWICSSTLDASMRSPEHEKTALTEVGPSPAVFMGCFKMLNDIFETVKPPMTAK